MPRRLLSLFALLCLTAGLGAEDKPNTLTDQEKTDGFKLLFDGQSTAGWKGYQKKEMPDGWKVVEGSLTRVGGGGDIVTEEEYASFEFRIDWRVAQGGNSGIMYHVQESERTAYMTGPEYQILDNERHPDGKSKLTSAGSCYALYPPTQDVCKPAGEWNQTRIIIKGTRVEHWLNGTKIVEFDKGSDEWKQKVADSKFKQWSEFGKPTKGRIALQDHGDKVEYRSIKIKVLD